MFSFESYELVVVIVLTRLLEAVAIVISIFLAFKGYKLRYVVATASIVFLSILTNLVGLVFRDYFSYIASVNFIITALILSGLVFYVIKNPEKTKNFTPPKEARCPVCNVLIIREDELCTAKIGNYTYFFDTCDHLIQLLKEPDFFVKRGNIFKGNLEEVYVKTKDTGRWKKLENTKIVEEKGKLTPYENPPPNSKIINLKEILDRAKDYLGSGKV